MTDVTAFEQPGVRGFLHRPDNATGRGLVLTHGAGGNCNMPLLVAAANAFAEAGFCVLRCDLPFRQRRPKGPPSPSTAAARPRRTEERRRSDPRPGPGAGVPRRAVVRWPPGDHARRRRAGHRGGSAAVFLPAAPAGQTRSATHRAFSAASGARGVCAGDGRPIRHGRGDQIGAVVDPGARPN